MSSKEPCAQCKNPNPLFLYYVYSNGNPVKFCTSCVLALFVGAFCPICFAVYKDKDLKPSKKIVNCSRCPAIAHFRCLSSLPASTSASESSSSITSVPYLCPRCFDPNFKYFDCQIDARTQLLGLNKKMGRQMLAASKISERCMKEPANFCCEQVERRAKEAVEARGKKSKHGQDEGECAVISSDSSGEESNSENNYTSEESSSVESSSEESTENEIESKENDNEGSCGVKGGKI